MLTELNAVLAEAAQRHNALIADVHAHFHGHGAATGDPAQPDPRPANTGLWFCGVIEPNGYGAHEIRRVWWRTLLGRIGSTAEPDRPAEGSGEPSDAGGR